MHHSFAAAVVARTAAGEVEDIDLAAVGDSRPAEVGDSGLAVVVGNGPVAAGTGRAVADIGLEEEDIDLEEEDTGRSLEAEGVLYDVSLRGTSEGIWARTYGRRAGHILGTT